MNKIKSNRTKNKNEKDLKVEGTKPIVCNISYLLISLN